MLGQEPDCLTNDELWEIREGGGKLAECLGATGRAMKHGVAEEGQSKFRRVREGEDVSDERGDS